MSSFAMVLLEEGVEMELPTSLSEFIKMLDQVVPGFTCENYGYRLGQVNRAQLGSRWDLSVRLVDLSTDQAFDDPVGCLELERVEEYLVRFKVPPRVDQDFPGMSKFDYNGQYYGSFIYQMLNTLHNNQLIQLPGVLPLL